MSICLRCRCGLCSGSQTPRPLVLHDHSTRWLLSDLVRAGRSSEQHWNCRPAEALPKSSSWIRLNRIQLNSSEFSTLTVYILFYSIPFRSIKFVRQRRERQLTGGRRASLLSRASTGGLGGRRALFTKSPSRSALPPRCPAGRAPVSGAPLRGGGRGGR